MHPRFQTPWVSTISFGVVSIVWFVALQTFSTHVLVDSVTGLGFLIAFYYGFTGLACTIYYRRTLLRSVKNFVFAGVMPLLGFLALAFVFVRAYMNYSHSGAGASPPLLGVQIPIVIGIGAVLLGLALMIPSWAAYRGGYSAAPEVAPRTRWNSAADQPHLSQIACPSMTAPRITGEPMIDPMSRWAAFGEKPDYAGLLTFSSAPLHRGSG